VLWGKAEQVAQSFLQNGDSDPLYEESMSYSQLQGLFLKR